MKRFLLSAAVVWFVFPASAVRAQATSLPAGTSVCVSIDEARDTLAPQEREAARLFVAREFERAGATITSGTCPVMYVIAHVKLGRTIAVTLSGPNVRRDGVALGLDDLPALYSQMVRSIVTGRPMSDRSLVDRTNVTATQASPRRLQAESFGYARLGFSGTFGSPDAHGAPAIGAGYRVELDEFAVDVSFFNSQIHAPDSVYAAGVPASSRALTGSLLKLEGLRFLAPAADASWYLGGGLSWGVVDLESGTSVTTSTRGSGLQAEFTAGYELARASTLRLFVQADATLPLFRATSETIAYAKTGPAILTGATRYTPSIVVSVGIGWHRDRRR